MEALEYDLIRMEEKKVIKLPIVRNDIKLAIGRHLTKLHSVCNDIKLAVDRNVVKLHGDQGVNKLRQLRTLFVV